MSVAVLRFAMASSDAGPYDFCSGLIASMGGAACGWSCRFRESTQVHPPAYIADMMADRGLDRALSGIVKNLDPVAVATYDNGRGILVVAESPIDSRAKRAEVARDSAGRAGRMYDYIVITPWELKEIKFDSDNPISSVIASCKVIHGSLQ